MISVLLRYEMIKNDDVFMNIEGIGDLYFFDVLLYYEYPRIFVCEDTYDSKYIFYEMASNDENKDVWLVSKIRKPEYYDIIDRKVPIQSVYKNRESLNIFSVTKVYGETDQIIRSYDNVISLKNSLPKNKVFADSKVINDMSNETLKKAKEISRPIFDIRFFAGSDRHYLSTSIFTEISDSIKSFLNMFSSKNERLDFSAQTLEGSCILRLVFSNQINLFGDNASIDVLELLNTVLTSDNLSDSIAEIKDQNRFIESYSKFLKAIKTTNSDVEFSSAFPNSKKATRFSLINSSIANKYNEIKNTSKKKQKKINIIGNLIALDTKNKKFKLETENEIVSGSVDDSVLLKSKFEIPNLYGASIIESSSFNNKNVCEKKEYKLIGLVKK